MSQSLVEIAKELVVEHFDKLKVIHSRENVLHITVVVAKRQLETIHLACFHYLYLGGDENLARVYYLAAERMYLQVYERYFKRGIP